MKKMVLVLALAALAACEKADPVADEASNTAGLPAPAESNASSPDGAPPPENAANAPEAADGKVQVPAAAIPAAFHGRWGLTPGDCTSTRGDAKGLLTIDASALRFYESRAVPAGNVQASGDSFSADFAFTGEGMEWTKFLTLELQDDKLVRTESSPMASFTYARCG